MAGAKHRLRRLNSKSDIADDYSGKYVHTVMIMTMKNGEQYAVDFSGAQYGWHETIMPWALYSSSRIEEVMYVEPLGYTRDSYKMHLISIKDQNLWEYQILEEFACYVQDATMLWELEGGLVAHIFRLPFQEAQPKIGQLLSTVEEMVRLKKQDQQSKGKYDVLFID